MSDFFGKNFEVTVMLPFSFVPNSISSIISHRVAKIMQCSKNTRAILSYLAMTTNVSTNAFIDLKKIQFNYNTTVTMYLILKIVTIF